MKDVLAFIGLIAIGGSLLLIATIIFEFIRDKIQDLKRDYRIKHRFDKPPTAKCYCVDCTYYNSESGRCYRFHEKDRRLVADCWFCYEAEPRKE